MKPIYIVDVVRTPVGKAPRGVFKHTMPDDLLVHTMRSLQKRNPDMDWQALSDVVIGCAMPEAEQGMNVARTASLLAGIPDSVPAMTLNRFCSSGVQSIATAGAGLLQSDASFALAGGVESMSMVPMGGNKCTANPAWFHSEHVAIAYGMGLTAEKVAKRYNISREQQDEFAVESHRRAIAAQMRGDFNDEISPITLDTGKIVTQDEGPRADTSYESIARLKPVFALKGSVTAGNTSQMSDGAGIALLASEEALNRHQLKPMGRLIAFAVAGVPPEIMGIGPVAAIPLALKQAGLTIADIDWIELNEAFAAQALAVMETLDLPKDKVNPLGGAIALGHPLGATGIIRTATVLYGLRRTKKRYGMVAMCIGTGMGAAAIFEAL